jgi:putative transposase
VTVGLADRMVETVRYTYRLRPGKQAEAALEAEWHRCRWLWNEAVHQQKSGSKPTLLARRVADDHGLIAVEDFKPKFLAKSTMARKAADAAISATKRTLIEYGRRAGRKVVLVRPAYTTMTCSECFARNKRLSLKVRTFQCATCGHTADRDRNAARVILAVAERGHTCVDDLVSFLPRPRSEPEIP